MLNSTYLKHLIVVIFLLAGLGITAAEDTGVIRVIPLSYNMSSVKDACPHDQFPYLRCEGLILKPDLEKAKTAMMEVCDGLRRIKTSCVCAQTERAPASIGQTERTIAISADPIVTDAYLIGHNQEKGEVFFMDRPRALPFEQEAELDKPEVSAVPGKVVVACRNLRAIRGQ